jgi:hypothetical protein
VAFGVAASVSRTCCAAAWAWCSLAPGVIAVPGAAPAGAPDTVPGPLRQQLVPAAIGASTVVPGFLRRPFVPAAADASELSPRFCLRYLAPATPGARGVVQRPFRRDLVPASHVQARTWQRSSIGSSCRPKLGQTNSCQSFGTAARQGLFVGISCQHRSVQAEPCRSFCGSSCQPRLVQAPPCQRLVTADSLWQQLIRKAACRGFSAGHLLGRQPLVRAGGHATVPESAARVNHDWCEPGLARVASPAPRSRWARRRVWVQAACEAPSGLLSSVRGSP